MRTVLRAEWTKFRTAPGMFWLLLALVAVTVGGGAATAASIGCTSSGCAGDPARISLTGIQLGQAVVVIVAALLAGGEYRTGMIHTTLAATPRRITVLAAKAVVIAGVVGVAGTVAVAGSVLAGRAVLPGNGFTAAHGFAALSLSDPPVLRAASGSVLYLVLIAVLTVGVAMLARDSASAIGIVLGLLYVLAIVTQMVSDPQLRDRLEDIGPMSAGLSIQATRDLASLPLSPWEGLAVVTAWAGGALLAGGVLLRFRDA
jgi:ABC-2 type transport system permease protein